MLVVAVPVLATGCATGSAPEPPGAPAAAATPLFESLAPSTAAPAPDPSPTAPTSKPYPTESSAPAQEMTITYQDGTTVTWPGPTQGEGWTVGPDGLDAPSYDPEDPGQTTNGDPATEQGQRLGAWDDRVRARIAGLGYNEELWMRPRPDGQFSFADSVGLHGSFTWAQGPELTRLDLDPCSHWPASSALEQPLGGGTCRVLMIDGHPVVTSERPFDETSRSALTSVFTVRPDGVAVSLVQPSLEREPTLTREDLARAALTLPAP